MESKIDIERKVVLDFFENTEKVSIDENLLKVGEHYKNEPDIIFNKIGIEVGAIISEKNTQIEKFEKLFFDKANALLKGKIDNRLSIKLVFQENREYFKHKPKDEFSQYPTLAKFLDGVFIHLYPKAANIQLSINQIGLMRTDTFPNPKNKEIIQFIDELTEFVNTKGHDEFKEKAFNSGDSYCSHYIVCDGEQIKERPNQLDKFFSKKIIEKFTKDKYSGDFTESILLLHNYNPLIKEIFSSDTHFYSHHKDHIFNKIHNLIDEHNVFKIYNKIFFVDYSVFAHASDCVVIDFSTYESKKIGVFKDEIHIRKRLTKQ